LSWSIIPGAALLGAIMLGRIMLFGDETPGAVPQTLPLAAQPGQPLLAASEPAPTAEGPLAQPLAPEITAAPASTPTPLPAATPRTSARQTSERLPADREAAPASKAGDPAPLPAAEGMRPRAAPAETGESAPGPAGEGSLDRAASEAPGRPTPLSAAEGSSTTGASQEVAEPPQRGPGMLRINSRPWARVIVDGKPMGNTPLRALWLPAGSHEIELVNDELQMRRTLQVHIEPGQVTTRVETLDE
jgi:hypothetical protein